MKSPRLPLAALATPLLAALAAAQQDILISPPLARIDSFKGLPDGSGAVYRVIGWGALTSDLFGSRYGIPSLPHDLEDASSNFVPGPYAVSSDSSRLVYLTSSAIDYLVCELYSQPLDGSAPPVKLNGPLTTEEDVYSFQVSPDSQRVLFVTTSTLSLDPRLFSVPIDGSAAPVEIDGPAPYDNSSPRISPDGRYVFYETVNGYFELWRAPMDASAPAQVLPGRGQYSSEFRFTSDSARVLYCLSLEANPALLVQLLSAPVDGSSPAVVVHPPLVTGGKVEREFALTPDGSSVVYAAEQEVDNRYELYVAPADASAPPVKLNGPSGADLPRLDRNNWWLEISGSRAFYPAFRQSQGAIGLLMSVPVDGSSPPLELLSFLRTEPPLTAIGRTHLAYLDRTDGPAFYSLPVDGSAPPVRLTPPFVAGGDVSGFRVDPTGQRLLYLADQELDGRRELYWMPLDGSRPVRKVNPPLAPGGQVGYAYGFTPEGNRVTYLAEVHQATVPELFLDYLTPMVRAR